MNWIITTGVYDMYDLTKNKITKKNIFRDPPIPKNIYKGQKIILYDDDDLEIKDGKEYIILDYLEFCDRNNQIVYACLEDLRDQKLKDLGL